MKTVRMIGTVLCTIMLGFTLSSCESDNDDDNFIEVDYSKDLVGTWTCYDANFAEALVINADGTFVSTGVEDGEYWEGAKGTISVKNNLMTIDSEDGDDFEGRFEIITGEAFVIIDPNSGERLTYRYCKQNFAKEIIGMWVCVRTPTGEGKNMMIQTFDEKGNVIKTATATDKSDFILNGASAYKVIGDLFIQNIPDNFSGEDSPRRLCKKLNYIPDASESGDILTISDYALINGKYVEVSESWLRIKQNLELSGQKYDYVRTYVTNANGLDQDFKAGDVTINISKLDGSLLDKMMKALLFTVEFPDANTIKYSYTENGETVSASAPIEVEGNKMTVKMAQTRGLFRDMDLYVFQDKHNSQMHIYMSKYAFINYFGNIAITLLEAKGEIDPHDQAATDAVFNELTQMVETINVSFIMNKAK